MSFGIAVFRCPRRPRERTHHGPVPRALLFVTSALVATAVRPLYEEGYSESNVPVNLNASHDAAPVGELGVSTSGVPGEKLPNSKLSQTPRNSLSLMAKVAAGFGVVDGGLCYATSLCKIAPTSAIVLVMSAFFCVWLAYTLLCRIVLAGMSVFSGYKHRAISAQEKARIDIDRRLRSATPMSTAQSRVILDMFFGDGSESEADSCVKRIVQTPKSHDDARRRRVASWHAGSDDVNALGDCSREKRRLLRAHLASGREYVTATFEFQNHQKFTLAGCTAVARRWLHWSVPRGARAGCGK